MALRVRILLLLAPLAFSLVACQQSPDTTLAASTAAAANSNESATGSAGFISVAPSAMAACNPAMASVKWDLHGNHPDVQTVDIFVTDGSKTQLFSEGGASGESKTGPWTRPGTTFILKNKANSEKLDEVRVSGPVCQE